MTTFWAGISTCCRKTAYSSLRQQTPPLRSPTVHAPLQTPPTPLRRCTTIWPMNPGRFHPYDTHAGLSPVIAAALVLHLHVTHPNPPAADSAGVICATQGSSCGYAIAIYPFVCAFAAKLVPRMLSRGAMWVFHTLCQCMGPACNFSEVCRQGVCVCAVGRSRCEIMCDSLQCLLILLTGERHTPVPVQDHPHPCTWN